MLYRLAILGLQYSAYALELMVLAVLFRAGRWKRLPAVLAYVGLFFAIDGLARPLVLYHYGRASVHFAYFYWLTDILLALAAFLLICAFFRRACSSEQKLWGFLRLLLVFVFILVLGISLLSLSRNYSRLFTSFIIEFGQNLYFTCLVLNTLLYILLQQFKTADDELGLLVCGMGIQYAGPAASFALFHLTAGQAYARSLTSFAVPLCTSGMFLLWSYALAWMPRTRRVRSVGWKATEMEEVPVFRA